MRTCSSTLCPRMSKTFYPFLIDLLGHYFTFLKAEPRFANTPKFYSKAPGYSGVLDFANTPKFCSTAPGYSRVPDFNIRIYSTGSLFCSILELNILSTSGLIDHAPGSTPSGLHQCRTAKCEVRLRETEQNTPILSRDCYTTLHGCCTWRIPGHNVRV